MWFRSKRRPRHVSSARRPYFRPRVEALEDRCLLSNGGALDTTFGNGAGYVTVPTGHARAVLVQPWDNKIVVTDDYAKGSNTLMGLVRYNTDGTLDSTFGNGGVMNSQVPGGAYAAALYPQNAGAVVILPNGQIVLEGGNELARYNSNGTLTPERPTTAKSSRSAVATWPASTPTVASTPPSANGAW